MKALDGKLILRDVLDTEGIFRLIESVPSPKAEPFNFGQFPWVKNELMRFLILKRQLVGLLIIIVKKVIQISGLV